MSIQKNLVFIFLVLIVTTLQPLAVWACATCGCSELCPLTMMQDTETNKSNKGALSDSLWGSIILKIAYLKDPEMQRLTRHKRVSNTLTAGAVSGAVGGTTAQNIISLATLNPPDGQSDSYLPGALGLGLSGLINIAFDGNLLFNWHCNKKIKARQLAIRNQVESILNHLEFSQANCPEAQKDLAGIVGPKAARECLQLWTLGHATVAANKDNTMSDASTKQIVF